MIKLNDLITEDKISNYLKSNKGTFDKLLRKMDILLFLKGIERDIKNHTGIDVNHDKLKDDIIYIFFDGVEPEFKDDNEYKDWESF